MAPPLPFPRHPRRASVPTDERHTPDWLFNPLAEEFRFTLDAAATRANARCKRFLTAREDGLATGWAGERVWCNPPWSVIPAWVEKAWREVRGDCPLVVMLVPDNRCHQPWWQTLVEPARERVVAGVRLTTRFLPRRPHFGTPTDPLATRKSRPKHGCALLVFRAAPVEAAARLAMEQLALALP